MKRILLVICVSMLVLLTAGLNNPLTAQPQHYNFSAGTSENSYPFNVATGKRVQLLYLPGDFNQPTPAPAGAITTVSFLIRPGNPLGPWSYEDFTIQMGQSAITSFTAGSFYAGPLTTVYYRSSVLLSGTAGQWMTLTLDTPFPYDPTQSLIVDVSQCGAVGAAGVSATATLATGNRRIWSDGGCPFVYHGADQRVYAMGITLGASLIIGNTVSAGGNLVVPKVSYTGPREHVTSVGGEAFVPRGDQPYSNGGSNGGAYITASNREGMVAAVQLPHGATVTKFRAYFYDNSSNDLGIYLSALSLTEAPYVHMANVTTSGTTTEYRYLETTSINQPSIDNIQSGYHVLAIPVLGNTWDGSNLRIRGASIYYTLPEAP